MSSCPESHPSPLSYSLTASSASPLADDVHLGFSKRSDKVQLSFEPPTLSEICRASSEKARSSHFALRTSSMLVYCSELLMREGTIEGNKPTNDE